MWRTIVDSNSVGKPLLETVWAFQEPVPAPMATLDRPSAATDAYASDDNIGGSSVSEERGGYRSRKLSEGSTRAERSPASPAEMMAAPQVSAKAIW